MMYMSIIIEPVSNYRYSLDMSYDSQKAKEVIDRLFDQSLVPALSEFVAIPNLSRHYDPEYATNGLLQKAAKHLQSWVQNLGIKGLHTEVLEQKGLTPFLLVEIDAQIKDKSILFYGHFDKQPYMTGWDQNKSPATPMIENGRLYGRGSVDDGYNFFSSMLSIKTLQEQNIPLPKIIFICQGDEESGNHIESYLALLKDRLGELDIIFCLDSGCYDYNRLWITKSIRGEINCMITIKTLNQGVHSGQASGIVPSPFKIFNLLISRLEDLETGKVHPFFNVDIPAKRYEQLYLRSQKLGKETFSDIRTVGQLRLVSENPLELLINKGWKPQLTVTGINGLPPVSSAGNVMLPELSFKLSLRIPPTLDSKAGAQFLNNLLTKDIPFGAKVTIHDLNHGGGWSSPLYQPWLEESIQKVSQNVFGLEALSLQEGGTIPIIDIIAKFWPSSQIIVSGAAGPDSGAHGPNQYLDLAYTKKLIYTITELIALSSEHYQKAPA